MLYFAVTLRLVLKCKFMLCKIDKWLPHILTVLFLILYADFFIIIISALCWIFYWFFFSAGFCLLTTEVFGKVNVRNKFERFCEVATGYWWVFSAFFFLTNGSVTGLNASFFVYFLGKYGTLKMQWQIIY